MEEEEQEDEVLEDVVSGHVSVQGHGDSGSGHHHLGQPQPLPREGGVEEDQGVLVTRSALLAKVQTLGGGGANSGWRALEPPGHLEASWEEEREETAAGGPSQGSRVSVCLTVKPT